MSADETRANEAIGTLGSCLIEGDGEQQTRERKTKRRALGISVVLQGAAITTLLLIPVLGRTEKIDLRRVTPMPPIGRYGVEHPRANAGPVKPDSDNRVRYQISDSPVRPRLGGTTTASDPSAPTGPDIGEPGIPYGDPIGIPGVRTPGPARPVDAVNTTVDKKRLYEPNISPAMLLRKIEPIYPPLARQLHKAGRVELRAIIATDGSIQSLQVVSGDPLFYESAKQAVMQWLYKPTYLNTHPVEVETYITVIYTLN